VEVAVFRDLNAAAPEDDGYVVTTQRAVPAITSLVERAYDAHYRDVYRYVLALTRSAADAEEVTAEVFERAMRTWSSEPERVEAWLLLTARRIATDRWRRARRLITVLSRIRTSDRTDPGQERAEFWTWFDAVSRVLTHRQREALVLRYQQDLSDADIASVLGLSESGVRSLVARALETLRAHPELL
jgi:RNA polymerase sigma-70 factor (ECF subfamily)